MNHSHLLKHLLVLFGSTLLVVQTPSLARAQQTIQLSDSLLAATDELRVRQRTHVSGMWNYRFGGYFVLSREGGGQTANSRTRGPILDRRSVSRGQTSFRYAVKGADSARATVRVRRSVRVEVRRPLTIGARFEGPEDTVEVADSTSAIIVFEEDTAAAWVVTMVERSGTAIPSGYDFAGTISSGTRTIRLVPVRSLAPRKRRGLAGLFGGSAHGYLFEEEGSAFAAVQYSGAGMSPGTDLRVWMPKGITARERHELAAIFTVVLQSGLIPEVQPEG